MRDDPVISRIRQARHSISKKCGHDPKKLITYYMQRQKINSSEHSKEKMQGNII